MSQECNEICQEIQKILEAPKSSFQKCEKINNILHNEKFGNDLLLNYPNLSEIIQKHSKSMINDSERLSKITKHILDLYVTTGKIGSCQPEDILTLVKSSDGTKTTTATKDDVFNQPIRIIERMLNEMRQTQSGVTGRFIQKAKEICGDLFDYTCTVYVSRDVPVIFDCKDCGNRYERLPAEHLSKSFFCFDCFIRKNSRKPLEKSHSWSQIMDGLYLGEYRTILKMSTIASCKIKAIVDLTNGTTLPRAVNQLKLKKCVIKVSDHVHANIEQYFKECINFIDEQLAQKRNVLVYCKQGVSRSASIIIAYLMAKTRAKYDVVYGYVKKRRQQILPNRAFIKQLKHFEQQLSKSGE